MSKKIELPYEGKLSAPILVLCDPPRHYAAWNNAEPLTKDAYRIFTAAAKACGFSKEDFCFVCPCPPIPEELQASDKKIAAFVEPYREPFLDLLNEAQPKLLMYTGKWAGRIATGRATQIMKARGAFTRLVFEDIGTFNVLPMLSPAHVLSRPEMQDIFNTDFMMAETLRNTGWKLARMRKEGAADKNYRWCLDLKDLLDNPPKAMALDTETTGLKWYTAGEPGGVRTLTVQICVAPGDVRVVPLDCKYYPKLKPAVRTKLIRQLKQLIENPRTRRVGHNLKYDAHILWREFEIHCHIDTDTQLLAFAADENMQQKNIDECVRRWVPEMAGFNDAYNKKLNKEDMASTSHEDMLGYAGGDPDATYRLACVLTALVKADEKQWNCYQRVVLPAYRAFVTPVEEYGVKINSKILTKLEKELTLQEQTMYEGLISTVPKKIIQKFADPKKPKNGLSFTRDDFVREILFTKTGLNLKPRAFTKSTAKLPPAEQIPSVSTKQHLPYFSDEPFVAQYMEYIKLQKLRSTYMGVPHDEAKDAPTGFWQYIHNGEIHPSFLLHRTVTGRAASVSPNGQNFPKRGKLAKAYREIFVARKDYVFIETDLSQAEIRIAACMANEKNMIKVYANGGDIHATTAAHTMGLTLKQFMAQDEETIDQKRFQAKAVNFGFLYGMWWRKFKVYAKTDYGIELTDSQAEAMREAFFDAYPDLEAWHVAMREFVKEHGYVRALHGAIRRLPSIYSDEEYIRKECERQAINSPVQRFASDLGLIAMQRIARDADPEMIRPLLFVHDALVLEVHKDVARDACNWAKFYMETPPLKEWFNLRLPVPVVADVAVGPSLGQMEKVKTAKAIAPSWYDAKADAL